jgi:hypothetical protein
MTANLSPEQTAVVVLWSAVAVHVRVGGCSPHGLGR